MLNLKPKPVALLTDAKLAVTKCSLLLLTVNGNYTNRITVRITWMNYN